MTRSEKPLLALKRRINSPKQLRLSNTRLGQRGESQAASWLIRRGFLLVDHNIIAHHTEIDVLAYHPLSHSLLLVEVKTRSTQIIPPCSAVSSQKKNRMWRLSEWLTINWQHYLDWRQSNLPTNSMAKSFIFAPIATLSTVFPKSARFAIISVVGKQVECLIAAPW